MLQLFVFAWAPILLQIAPVTTLSMQSGTLAREEKGRTSFGRIVLKISVHGPNLGLSPQLDCLPGIILKVQRDPSQPPTPDGANHVFVVLLFNAQLATTQRFFFRSFGTVVFKTSVHVQKNVELAITKHSVPPRSSP